MAMGIPQCFKEWSGGTTVVVWAKPRASRTKITGFHDGALSVAIAATPVDGAANTELVRFIAKKLGIPKSSVEMAGGETGRNKTLHLRGVSISEAAKILAP